MKSNYVYGLCALACVTVAVARESAPRAATGSPGPAAVEDNIAVFFSPNGGCADAIVDQLNAAKKSVHMQAYFFASPKIAKAVAAVHKRGVDVDVIVDQSVETVDYSSAPFLFEAGVPTFVDAEHKIAHNKTILIDGQVIITGSFNFTAAADTDNAENLLIINNKKILYAAYEKNFQEHLKHSKKFDPKDKKAPTRKGDN